MVHLLKSLLWLPWAALMLGARMASSLTRGSSAGSPAATTTPSASGAPSVLPPGAPPDTVAAPAVRTVNSGRLNTASFVVLGEGLAAGMGDFSLSDATQPFSFPAQIARQMETDFAQPLIQPPGIGEVPGFAPWTVVVPSPLQSTVIEAIPPDYPRNLSVPGLTVTDTISMRPQEPLIDRTSSKQTTLNLILGLRGIAYGTDRPLPTQLESAIQRQPTLALVELGYAEALEAAVSGDPQRLPDAQCFHADYSKLVKDLHATGAQVILLTIPNPIDTAYFSNLQSASEIVKLDPPLLRDLWGLAADDLITVNGLNEISFQIYAASIGPESGDAIAPLGPRSVLSSQVAAEIQSKICSLNQEISSIATSQEAVVYDLNAFIKGVQDRGITIGSQRLIGGYLGGFYSLNGYYPGATGHALIANEILEMLNSRFGADFPLIDVTGILTQDPVAAYKRAEGPSWTLQELTSPQPLPLPPPTVFQGTLPPPQEAVSQVVETTSQPLRLPPGLEQVLPLNPEASYFGDALSAQNCFTPQTIQWSSCGNLYFRGLAMMDSHLAGNIRIKFSPPVDGWTTFQLSFEGGLRGADAFLAAPVFFQMPGKQQFVGDVPGLISEGRLNVQTGQVDPTPGTLNIYVTFFNSALFALLRVNPDFPKIPLSFPGQYGSATVKFEQRADGKLDFIFSGSTFVPLSADGTAFPLNFCGPSRQFASVPAAGTALHPHMSLTTKVPQAVEQQAGVPEIPFNTIREFTLFTPASSFGDYFTLFAPQLGGPAVGRSRLLGRVQIQFGPPSGNSVPIAVSTSTAGGVLAPLGPTPLADLFPGRLEPGPEGFYENLRFPFRTYSLNDLAVLDDPFDLSVGALDLRTGEALHQLLNRGFINQDLIFALLRVEPRTPKNSFYFRGPASLKRGPRGGEVFSFVGQVHIPYPPGFQFPDTNLATGFPVIGGGSLDPYLWMWAVTRKAGPDVVQTGKADRIRSSRGDIYSYRFEIPANPSKSRPVFRYENFTQQGRFQMHSLAWIDFGNVNGGPGIDTVTFSGFGVWTKSGAPLETPVSVVTQVAAQFSTSSAETYVGIQIGTGGEISNVNTWSPTAFSLPIEVPSLAASGASADVSQPSLSASTAGNSNPAYTNRAAYTNRKDQPMYSHIIELTAKPGQAKALVDIIRDRAIPEIIRNSEGFVDEIVLLSDTDPNHVSAISFWRSKQDGDQFFQNGFAKVSLLTKPYLSAKPESHEFVVGASTNPGIAGWR